MLSKLNNYNCYNYIYYNIGISLLYFTELYVI